MNVVTASIPSAEVLHFTGHAVTKQDGASLVLRDGSISAETIDNLSLTHCRLVVLASCATFGIRTSERTESLDIPGAFLRAGVKTVVASRWNVDSRSTRLLMLMFYDELLKGVSPAVALKKAQDEMREQTDFQHPFYWSSFCVLEQ